MTAKMPRVPLIVPPAADPTIETIGKNERFWYEIGHLKSGNGIDL